LDPPDKYNRRMTRRLSLALLAALVLPACESRDVTTDLKIVTVQTARGTVVLTSDAAHFYKNVETYQPVQIITNLPEMLAAFDTIHALAGAEKLIVAGHDPLVNERFTTVEPGIIKIV